MKNENILPGQIVPEDIRLELYKEALEKIDLCSRLGLCLYLPMLLWGLNNALQSAPNGEGWYWEDTEEMFPEMDGISRDMRVPYCIDPRNIRIQYLESAIAKLSNK